MGGPQLYHISQTGPMEEHPPRLETVHRMRGMGVKRNGSTPCSTRGRKSGSCLLIPLQNCNPTRKSFPLKSLLIKIRKRKQFYFSRCPTLGIELPKYECKSVLRGRNVNLYRQIQQSVCPEHLFSAGLLPSTPAYSL